MVEHVATREQQDGNQATRSPQVSIPDNGKDVWREDREQGDRTQEDRYGGDQTHVVDWAHKRWLRAFGKMTVDPCIDLVGGDRAVDVSRAVSYAGYMSIPTH